MRVNATIILLMIMGLIMGCAPKTPKVDLTDTYKRISFKTTTINRHELAYTVTGTGPPIILLHGFAAQGWMWEHQQSDLAKKFTVYTIDLLGHGYSDRPHIAYTPDVFIDSIKEFISALNLTDPILIGNSMGAGIAIGMAVKYPQVTQKIVLIGGFPQGVREKVALRSYRVFLQFKPEFILRIGAYFSGKSFLRRTLEKLVIEKSLITDDVVDRAYQFRTFPGFSRVLFSIRNNLWQWEEKYAPQIPKISTPTLILWGTHDALFPREVGQELHKKIQNSKFIAIENTGHLSMWEKPKEVNREIIDFLHTQ